MLNEQCPKGMFKTVAAKIRESGSNKSPSLSIVHCSLIIVLR
jgi:hypothetical protein